MDNNLFNGITEFKNKFNTNEIKIWIYTRALDDINTQHNENYNVIKELKKINRNSCIVFFENIIGSFEEIKNWNDTKYLREENRAINIERNNEKQILQRLLLEHIKVNIDLNKYEVKNNYIYLKEPVYYKNNLIVKRKIKFDINIEPDKEILVGFDLSHGFDYINTLDKDIDTNNIAKGELVKDYYYGTTYEFIKIAPFSINDENKYMNTSIINYYINKNQKYIVSNLNPKMKAVLVKLDNKIFPYIPNRLKKVCTYNNIQQGIIKDINKYIKLKSHDRMKISIDTTLDILENNKYIKFSKKNMLIENLGYEKNILNKPKFKFGKGEVHNTILYGLPKFGSYENKEIEVSYFIDPEIMNNDKKYNLVKNFAKEIELFSKEMNVKINRICSNIDFKEINTKNKDLFEQSIRDIVENYKNPVIVILENYNCEKYYTLLKKLFGNKNNIPTQFIELSTLNYNEKNKNAIFLNILLGVYGKCGIQPWILNDSLSADCYVGIDVSRENNLNTAGVIQIVGKNGKILRSKSIAYHQRGEKINIETMREIFHEATFSYKKVYGKNLNNIVIHRDGINREEIEILKETANNLGIKFDYVEVTKNISRRIATLNIEDKIWKTEIGAYFTKEDTAYMVTTNPFESLGMAKPIRVRKIYGNENIHNIVSDVYKLSYMHVGSILKSRLPVTTHYADLSATYGNRELMPSNVDSRELHFI